MMIFEGINLRRPGQRSKKTLSGDSKLVNHSHAAGTGSQDGDLIAKLYPTLRAACLLTCIIVAILVSYIFCNSFVFEDFPEEGYCTVLPLAPADTRATSYRYAVVECYNSIAL